MKKNTVSVTGNTLISSRGNPSGRVRIPFFHQATGGDTVIDFSSLNTPTGFSNSDSSVLLNGLRTLGGLFLTNGSGQHMLEGYGALADFRLVGCRAILNNPAEEGELFGGYIEVNQSPTLSLVETRPLNVREVLSVGQTRVSIGQPIKIPGSHDDLQISVKKNGIELPWPEAWDFVASDSGYSSAIDLAVAGVDLGGGELEIVTIQSVGFIAINPPSGTLTEIEKMQGQIYEIAQTLDLNLGIPAENILIHPPTSPDLIAFGDLVTDNSLNLVDALARILVLESKEPITAVSDTFTPVGAGLQSLVGNFVNLPAGKWKISGYGRFRSSGGSAGYSRRDLYWSNGNGGTTDPAGLIHGTNTATQRYTLSSDDGADVVAPTIIIDNASAQTIFLSPDVTAVTYANSRLVMQIIAEQIGV